MEDNPLNMELATDVLEAAGYHVVQADTAEAGIEQARFEHPDLILMDVALPGMDGVAAIRVLKQDPKTQDIPVVVVTAHAMKGDEEMAVEAGGSGYLTKPINVRTFPASVAAFLPGLAGVRGGGGRVSCPEPKRILIVDDEELNRELMGAMLETLGHTALFAGGGAEALDLLAPPLDLLLVDGMMPGMDGFTLVERVRRQPEFALVPIIMVTALSGRADRMRAVEAGANDFIAKPVDFIELRVRVGSLLKMKEAQDAVRRQQEELEQLVAERTSALQQALSETAEARQRTYDAHLDTIQRLALAAEHRDDHTAAHIERVSHYCGLLAWALDLPSEEIEVVRQGSRMHDVGKIGVPDSILLKESHLTPTERLVMQQHTVIGQDILSGRPRRCSRRAPSSPSRTTSAGTAAGTRAGCPGGHPALRAALRRGGRVRRPDQPAPLQGGVLTGRRRGR